MMRNIDDEAVSWAIRLADGRLDHAEDRKLADWLAEDPIRAGALLRAEAHLAYVVGACALNPAMQAEGVVPARGPTRRWTLAAVAAMTAVVIGSGARLLSAPGATYATGLGEVRRVQLADGSTAAINTASEVSADMSGGERLVAVRHGEAWFQVKHDRSRPFVVSVGDVRVRAVGTAFSVRLRDSGVDILVTDGIVETWRTDRPGVITRIGGGQSGYVDERQVVPVAITPTTSIDTVERRLAWRSGELALDGETVRDAVAEINRYNVRRVIVDPALENEALVGYFRNNDPEGFANGVARLIDGRVVHDGDAIRVTR